MRGTTDRAHCIIGNRAFFPLLRFHRFDGFAIAEAIIFIPELPVLFDKGLDDWELVGEELLVFGAVDVVMGPLPERNISANEKNKPANLLILFLNDSK